MLNSLRNKTVQYKGDFFLFLMNKQKSKSIKSADSKKVYTKKEEKNESNRFGWTFSKRSRT